MRRLGPVLLVCLAALPAAADVFPFASPSGNIQCWGGVDIGVSDVTCTIIERSGPPAAPRPATCAADWGHGFSMTDRGTVTMLCAPVDRARRT